jgi:Protein of unknown function (DUF3540)
MTTTTCISFPAPTIALDDGSTVDVEQRAAVIRDPEGQVICRYYEGHLELMAPSGDLRLAAPKGRVVIESAADVVMSAERDVIHRAGRRVVSAAGSTELEVAQKKVRVQSRKLTVEAEDARVDIGRGTLVAHRLATAAESLVTNVARYELTAEEVVTTASRLMHQVSDLVQTRAGRIRTLVQGAHSLYAERHAIVSEGDTSIDGKRIHLG